MNHQCTALCCFLPQINGSVLQSSYSSSNANYYNYYYYYWTFTFIMRPTVSPVSDILYIHLQKSCLLMVFPVLCVCAS